MTEASRCAQPSTLEIVGFTTCADTGNGALAGPGGSGMTDLDAVATPPPRPMPPSAGLWVAEVRVANFRNIVKARVPLEPGATFLVGENNAGKSSLLLAIAAACGAYRPNRDDLHRDGEAIASDATVDLIIRSAAAQFSEVVAQRLSGNYGDGPEPGEWTAIRTRLVGSRESSFLSSRRSYLAWDASTRSWVDTGRPPNLPVLELLAAQLVEASRDLSVDVFSRTSDWGRVLADLGVSATDRQDLEASLASLSGTLQEVSPTLSRLSQELLKMKDTQSGIEEVQLRPLPGRLEELARSVDILVGAGGGAAALPMRLQGLGSRSLAALRVFSALLELRIGADKGVAPTVRHITGGARGPLAPSGAGCGVPFHSRASRSSRRRNALQRIDRGGRPSISTNPAYFTGRHPGSRPREGDGPQTSRLPSLHLPAAR